MIPCLVICYASGFQIWDISGDEFREIINHKEMKGQEVNYVKILPNPTNMENDKFREDRPMAIVYSEVPELALEAQDGKKIYPIRLFSISNNSYVHKFSNNSCFIGKIALTQAEATRDYLFLVC